MEDLCHIYNFFSEKVVQKDILNTGIILRLETNLKAFKFNPFALRKAKIAYNFGLSGCKWVKE